MAATKTSIKRALTNPALRRALTALVGCPAGGWPETTQAMARIRDEAPRRSDRTWTVSELIDVAMEIDHADRYRWKDG